MHSLVALALVSLLASMQGVLAAAASDAPSVSQKQRPAPTFPLPPDTRPEGCVEESIDPEGRNYSDFKATIIIPYKNEKWDHIRLSLDSILYYTPKKYLSEIMLVSDGNTPSTGYILELQRMSKLITVLAFPAPGIGLIEAKMRAVGAAAVKSNILVFLEPHIRVNKAWLQPLLRRIRLHPTVLAMPALDLIPPDDFNQYRSGSPGVWRFEWNLNLAYVNPGQKAFTSKPMLSPATSGGIYAIRRDFWDTLEFFDTGMLGWGGDHVEATFKVWRCGGHIEVVTCSRVGHMFRDADQRPYPVAVDRVVQNYHRMAAVWFEGEHLNSFYKVKPEARAMPLGNLTEQLELKEKLKCKSMDWYLKNVDHELAWEESRICIPGCDHKVEKICCERSDNIPRTTIDRLMPPNEWKGAERAASPFAKDEL